MESGSGKQETMLVYRALKYRMRMETYLRRTLHVLSSIGSANEINKQTNKHLANHLRNISREQENVLSTQR